MRSGNRTFSENAEYRSCEGSNVHGKVRVVPGKSGQASSKAADPESDTCVFVEEKADIEGPEREHRDDFLAVTSMQSQNNTLPGISR